MIYVILALIAIVGVALWQSSKGQNSTQQEASNSYKRKPRSKLLSMKKAKSVKTPKKVKASGQPSPKSKQSQKRVYRTEAINLHHPAAHSDDIALTDQALGLSDSEETSINAGQPVILYLVATKDQSYGGFNLIQNLLSTGLKLHKNGIFDRVYETHQRSEILFQVASMKEPGTFPTSHVDDYQTPGLVFYMDPMNDAQIFKQRFESMMSQMTLVQSRIGGHVFTPDKTLLEAHDFNRYADYLISLGAVAQEA
jgi:cell division protein ZipA